MPTPKASPDFTPKPTTSPKPFTLIHYVIVFLVGISVGLLMFWVSLSVMPKTVAPIPKPSPVTPQPTPTPEPTPEPIPTPTPTPEPQSTTTTTQDLTKAILNVVWTEPIKRAPDIFFRAGYKTPPSAYDVEPREGNLYEKGYVRDGKYADYRVLSWEQIEYGMGTYSWLEVVLLSPDGTKALHLSDGNPNDSGHEFEIQSPNLRIATTPFPERLTLPNGKKLVRKTSDYTTSPDPICSRTSCPGIETISTTKENFTLYGNGYDLVGVPLDESSCLNAYDELGNSVRYVSLISYQESPTQTYPDLLDNSQIVWNAGIAVTSTYVASLPGGCGFRQCADLMTDAEVRASGTLAVVGHTESGDPLYIPTPLINHPETQWIYENWMGYSAEGAKPDLTSFLKEYPIPFFFWKDGLGRWVRYAMTGGIPQSECGKPVIYLYPEKSTNVSVKLPPFISVTKSEPNYPVSGWNVTAEPNGNLTMKDGSTYGSLFWEGTGVNYARPTEGFIVKDGSVDTFLTDVLKRYGLNEQESKEFREFWTPLMTGAPYYRVSFLTSAWSAAAPLSVSPRPQTNIRIFMDWQKLSAPISLKEPTIATPPRQGFTLVEWGGLLWK